MDVLGATVAHRYTQEEVDDWLAQLGFKNVARTINTDEIYRKAWHDGCSAAPHALEPATPPYWFEKWREENYQNLQRRDMYDPDKDEARDHLEDADQTDGNSR